MRAVRTPHVEPGLRQGLEALEHTAVAIRGLMRSVAEASDGDWLDQDSARDVLRDLAETFRTLAAGADAFGELVRHEGDVEVRPEPRTTSPVSKPPRTACSEHEPASTPRSTEARPADVVELYAATRATVRRLQHELGLDERVRRQLRLLPQRRLPTRPGVRRRSAGDVLPPTGPDDETQVIPRLPDEPPEAGP